MLDTSIKPKDLYRRRNELGLNQVLDLLIEILDNAKDDNKRKEIIKYIGLIGGKAKDLKKDCLELLENYVISEKNSLIQIEATKALGELQYEKGLKPLKWLLQQDDADSKLITAALRSISNIRMGPSEINLFIETLGRPIKTVKACVMNKLTLISPDILIRELLKSLTRKDFTDVHKSEIIKIIGFNLASIDVSFEGMSYLKVNFPETIKDLIQYKRDILIVITSNLRDDDKALFESSISILTLIGEEINEILIELIDDEDFLIKQNAIKIIGRLKINAQEIMDKLVENLDDMYSEISIECIKTLGEIGEVSMVPELLKALDIEDPEYEYLDIDKKWFILDAIQKIYSMNPTANYDCLYEGLRSNNDVIKESIAFIFGELGKEEFVDPLVQLLDERNLDVRKNVIIALGKIGNKRAIDKILAILDQDYVYWILKKISIDALYNIYYRNFRKSNNIDLKSKRDFIINREKLIDYIKNHNNECFKVKLSVIKFLKVFGDETALEALLGLVNDFHRLVQLSASKAIKAIEKRLEEEKEQKSQILLKK
ncbi:MAG: HEAT repeat domain-containing protein [Promethearchaeota archaeon]